MPSGRVHSLINLSALIPLVHWGAPALGVQPGHLAAGCGAYVFATFFLSPDLDLTVSHPSRRWKALALLWAPYGWLFRHRGLSHSLILGSLTRIAYLAILLCVAGWGYFILRVVREPSPERALAAVQERMLPYFVLGLHGLQTHLEWILAVLGGIWLSDLIHVLSDRLSTGLKRGFRL